MIRLLPALAMLVIAIAATWFIARRTAEVPTPVAAVATATGAPTLTPSVAVAQATPSPAHRLAGTVVGDHEFAVVENPDGRNDLYAVGEIIPELGKLVEVGPHSAAFDGPDGRFEMQVEPSSTPSPGSATAPVTPLEDELEEGSFDGRDADYDDEEYEGEDAYEDEVGDGQGNRGY